MKPACEKCGKPAEVCVCDRIKPIDTRLRVVILQHPQEHDVVLGTAKLLTLALPRAEIRIGLSWGSLAHALDDDSVRPERWPVLAGAKLKKPGEPTEPTEPIEPTESDDGAEENDAPPGVHLFTRHGQPLEIDSTAIDGVIVLDGTWSQAKALWWRNAWLLKLPRLSLVPREPSMYGKLRKEPRRGWVSTLEAVADVLPALGEPETTRSELRRLLRTMLQRARDSGVDNR